MSFILFSGLILFDDSVDDVFAASFSAMPDVEYSFGADLKVFIMEFVLFGEDFRNRIRHTVQLIC